MSENKGLSGASWETRSLDNPPMSEEQYCDVADLHWARMIVHATMNMTCENNQPELEAIERNARAIVSALESKVSKHMQED